MNAKEARKITQENLKGPAIQKYLDVIYINIKDAANKGRFEIRNPFSFAFSSPSPDEEEALREKLISEGYKIQDYPDPDPGHPCSSAYTLLSW